MAILNAKPDAISDSDHTLNRIFPVTAKLTKEERGRVTEFARLRGLARGEWIRDVILREMRGGSSIDPSLAGVSPDAIASASLKEGGVAIARDLPRLTGRSRWCSRRWGGVSNPARLQPSTRDACEFD